ncbi:MAG: MATE family efflux transporter [Anaeromyxobacter sp.]|nr:MATE family efflux transporter [Anaeromyxobacter sp.]MBL0275590.1 MATE family efflux transporter [Anaeromyxobacter sp.]
MSGPPVSPDPGEAAPAAVPGAAAAAPLAPGLRTLLTLAWPIVVSRSSQVVVGVSDAVMVAHLGAAALAATTTGAMNAFSVFILPMGVVFIVSSFASQLFGRGDRAGARRYGWYGLAVALATQAAGLAAIPALPVALAWLDLPADVVPLLATYLAIRLWSSGAAIGLEALANYYGGLGDTRRPMVANVAAMVLNVGGNWLLIDGHLGFAARGVAGAALASALATWLAFAGLLAGFLLEGRRLGAGRRPLSLTELLRMLRFGLPSGLNWFFEFLAFNLFVTVILAGLGTTTLAAFMAVLQVNSVAFMPAFGLASAGAILVGQAIGAGRRDDVPGVVWLTFQVAAGWQGLAGLLYLAAPALILAPFATDPASGPALLEAGARMLVLTATWQLFDAAAAVVGEALRAAGDTAFMLWARVAIAWGIFLPGSWISVRWLGGGDLVAVGWLVLYLGLLALVIWLRFRGGAWRRLELVEPAPLA